MPLPRSTSDGYGYVENDPIFFVDPSGLQSVTESINDVPISDPLDPQRELKQMRWFLEQLGGNTNPATGAQFVQNAELGFYMGLTDLVLGTAGTLPSAKVMQRFGNLIPKATTPARSCRGTFGGGGRAPRITKAESPIWQGLSVYKGKTRSSGTGSNRQFYQWDNTHGDIEVYDSRGNHLGSMHAITGAMYKPAVPGRTISP